MVKIYALPQHVTEISHEHPGYDTFLCKDGRLIVLDGQGIGIYESVDDFEQLGSPVAFVNPKGVKE